MPVVAAGGIADGRGLAAALALGADGAWLGDRFVATAESAAHEAYKRAVAAASEDETVYGEPFPRGWRGQPHRTLESGTTERWETAGCPALEARPDADETVARTPDGEPVERYADLPRSDWRGRRVTIDRQAGRRRPPATDSDHDRPADGSKRDAVACVQRSHAVGVWKRFYGAVRNEWIQPVRG